MTVTVKMLVDKLKLKVIYGNEKLLSKPITTADISRPGLEMTGYLFTRAYSIGWDEGVVLP